MNKRKNKMNIIVCKIEDCFNAKNANTTEKHNIMYCVSINI